MDYDEWLERLDEVFKDALGMHRSDFDDWGWIDDFDGDMSPEQAFNEWAERNGHDHLI